MFYKYQRSVSLPWRQDGVLTFFPYKAGVPVSPFSPSKAAKRFLKNVTSWFVQGTGFCFTFFPLKSMKCLLKKCHILMSAVTFSTNGLWKQYFIKNWECYRFIENTAPSKMAPKLSISLQTKAACYSPLFLKF